MANDNARWVADNVYETKWGWRVFVRRDGKLKPVRFKRTEYTFEEVLHFRDSYKLEAKRRKRERHASPDPEPGAKEEGFRADALRYLQLKTTKAMPSYGTREWEIGLWIPVFGHTPRPMITTSMIDEQLQTFKNAGYSGSTVNKFRTALMAMWTRLDGRSAANPVRDAILFDEASLLPRGQSYDLLTRILDGIPDHVGRGVKGEKGSRNRGSESRARLELLAATGLDPSQIKRMGRDEYSIKERWYVSRRYKGRGSRTPRPVIRKPMSPEAVPAFERMERMGLIGKTFSTQSLNKTWQRACRRIERELREEYADPKFTIPHIRLKDIRHSFATRLFAQVHKSKGKAAALEIVGLMIDHAPRSPMTLRYSLGAVPSALEQHMGAFKARRPRKGQRKTA